MSSLDKYTHTELVHIVDMFDIDMKMKDLKATKKELLKNLIDKGVHLKFKNSLPTKTEIKKEVEKAKKKPRSKVARVLAGQKKITESFKKKTEDKKASEQEKQEAKKEATKLRTSLADRFGKQAKAKDQPKDKKATKDEKGEARIGASRLRSRLSERFGMKAEATEERKSQAKAKQQRQLENEREEKETDDMLKNLKGKKLQSKIEEIVDFSTDDTEKARIYFKFGTPSILRSSGFKIFLENYIEEGDLNEDNQKFTNKEKINIVYSDFQREWKRQNPDRDFSKMMKVNKK